MKITTEKVKEYCKREKEVQKTTYGNLLARKKLTKSQVNDFTQIIKDLEQLAIEAEKKGLKWSEIIQLIQEKDDVQTSLF